MSRLTFTQKKIKACDRKLKRLYRQLRRRNNTEEFEEKLQEQINLWEEIGERLENDISL